MSIEKIFIRDLIWLCEQYKMAIFHCDDYAEIVNAKEKPELYRMCLDELEKLQ